MNCCCGGRVLETDKMVEHLSIHQIMARDETRVFTLAEAEALFPLVRAITEAAWRDLDPVRRKLEAMAPVNPQIHEIEQLYESIVKRWMAKMTRLGLVVKGLWLVDFDTGDGHLWWECSEVQNGQNKGSQDG